MKGTLKKYEPVLEARFKKIAEETKKRKEEKKRLIEEYAMNFASYVKRVSPIIDFRPMSEVFEEYKRLNPPPY